MQNEDSAELELAKRLGSIEALPLAERASAFEELHDELVVDLQQSSHEQGSE